MCWRSSRAAPAARSPSTARTCPQRHHARDTGTAREPTDFSSPYAMYTIAPFGAAASGALQSSPCQPQKQSQAARKVPAATTRPLPLHCASPVRFHDVCARRICRFVDGVAAKGFSVDGGAAARGGAAGRVGSPHLRSILFTKALAAQTGALTPSSRRGLAISKTIGIPYADHAALQDVCSAAGRGADEEEYQQRRRADGRWHMQPQQGGCRGGVSEWRGTHARACKNQTTTSLLLLLHTHSSAVTVQLQLQCITALTVAARGGRRWQSLPSGSAKEPPPLQPCNGDPLSVEGLYCFVVQIFKNLKANASHKFVGVCGWSVIDASLGLPPNS